MEMLVHEASHDLLYQRAVLILEVPLRPYVMHALLTELLAQLGPRWLLAMPLDVVLLNVLPHDQRPILIPLHCELFCLCVS